jgi:hypothetical protein
MDLTEFKQALVSGLGHLRREVAQRKAYFEIPAQNISNSGPVDVPFVSDHGYFQLKLSEMFLKDRREYWQEFLPFVLVICDFLYGGERRTVPVFAGKETLSGLKKYLENEPVEYRDTVLVGPTPFMGDDIGILIGLFRTRSADYAEQLMGMVGEIGKVFHIGELDRYLSLLKPLTHGINIVLGLKDVEFRLGVRSVYTSGNNLKSGFIALVNCPETALQRDQLWVNEDRLWIGTAHNKRRLTDFDYCLLKVEFVGNRNFAALPMAKLWNDIKGLVWAGHQENAETTFLELCRQLSISSDVTRPDRFNLIRVYKMNLESEIDLYASTMRPLGMRTERTASFLSGSGRIQKMLAASQASKLRPSILEMSNSFNGFLSNRPPHLELDENVLKKQMSQLAALPKAIEDTENYAATLVDVLTEATFRTRAAAS